MKSRTTLLLAIAVLSLATGYCIAYLHKKAELLHLRYEIENLRTQNYKVDIELQSTEEKVSRIESPASIDELTQRANLALVPLEVSRSAFFATLRHKRHAVKNIARASQISNAETAMNNRRR